jgi:DNA-binding response OmpR family regulator
MRVLLIDDDARLRQVLARLLRGAGFDIVDEACDGEDALLVLAQSHPDLIVTDCQMPRLDGIGFVRCLRASGDQTPVIMLSGQGDPHVVVTAIRAGVNNYLPKPINPEILFEKIHQTLMTAGTPPVAI